VCPDEAQSTRNQPQVAGPSYAAFLALENVHGSLIRPCLAIIAVSNLANTGFTVPFDGTSVASARWQSDAGPIQREADHERQ
jgi:hypothetical protein